MAEIGALLSPAFSACSLRGAGASSLFFFLSQSALIFLLPTKALGRERKEEEEKEKEQTETERDRDMSVGSVVRLSLFSVEVLVCFSFSLFLEEILLSLHNSQSIHQPGVLRCLSFLS